MTDREYEAYERGHFVATMRAINRQALGLPLEREGLMSQDVVDQGYTIDSWRAEYPVDA